MKRCFLSQSRVKAASISRHMMLGRRLSDNEAIHIHFHPTYAFPHHEFRGREASVPRPQQPLGEDEAKRAVALYMEHIEQEFPE